MDAAAEVAHTTDSWPSGSVARVGPNDLVTSDPELIKRMLNVRTPYKRSVWYNSMRLDPGKDNVISQRDDAIHGNLRTRMAPGVCMPWT